MNGHAHVLLTASELADLMGLSTSEIRRRRRYNQLPQPSAFSPHGTPLWKRETVAAWVNNRHSPLAARFRAIAD